MFSTESKLIIYNIYQVKMIKIKTRIETGDIKIVVIKITLKKLWLCSRKQVKTIVFHHIGGIHLLKNTKGKSQNSFKKRGGQNKGNELEEMSVENIQIKNNEKKKRLLGAPGWLGGSKTSDSSSLGH